MDFLLLPIIREFPQQLTRHRNSGHRRLELVDLEIPARTPRVEQHLEKMVGSLDNLD